MTGDHRAAAAAYRRGMSELIPASTVPPDERGEWRVARFSVSEEQARWSALRDRGRAVSAGEYTGLYHRGYLIMSDTPAEKLDHFGFVCRAAGNVLINGLGLGLCTTAVLRKPGVRSVTVVEKAAEVIDLVAPHIADRRLTVIHDDALTFSPPKGARYDVVWHDIWPDIRADNLSEMIRLHRRYGRRCKWQGSWARWYCEQSQRNDGR